MLYLHAMPHTTRKILEIIKDPRRRVRNSNPLQLSHVRKQNACGKPSLSLKSRNSVTLPFAGFAVLSFCRHLSPSRTGDPTLQQTVQRSARTSRNRWIHAPCWLQQQASRNIAHVCRGYEIRNSGGKSSTAQVAWQAWAQYQQLLASM